MSTKTRLDQHLVSLGLASSRQQAQQLIRAGRVRDAAGTLLDKPGQAALEIAVEGRICLDGGISTGGFSDCLLQAGAARVYGVDVGYGQTAWSLRTDERLVLKERTNLRHLQPADLYGPTDPWPDLAVADVSFISLVLVLPALGRLLAPGPADAVLLVKPQFEVGRQRVGKGGVVRDPQAHVDAITAVLTAAEREGWQGRGVVASPITGPAGNHEYLLWMQRSEDAADVIPLASAAASEEESEAGGPMPDPASEAERPIGLRAADLQALVRGTLG